MRLFIFSTSSNTVGAGQAGLQQAARNRQLGLRTLVVEQDARLGDVWRKRYPTLALHTPRSHHNCKEYFLDFRSHPTTTI